MLDALVSYEFDVCSGEQGHDVLYRRIHPRIKTFAHMYDTDTAAVLQRIEYAALLLYGGNCEHCAR